MATAAVALVVGAVTSAAEGLVTSVKTAAADLLTQKAALRRPWREVDVRRMGVFAMYGALYLGAVQYFLFMHAYPAILPRANHFAALPFSAKLRDGRGLASVLAQVSHRASNEPLPRGLILTYSS